jgi:hypothetical protein
LIASPPGGLRPSEDKKETATLLEQVADLLDGVAADPTSVPLQLKRG